MNLKTINISHIRLISLYWSRYAVRSGAGLVYLMIALVFGLSAAHIVIMPVEKFMALQQKQLGQADPKLVTKTVVDVGQPIIQFVLGIKSFEQVTKEAAISQPQNPNGNPKSAQAAKKTAGYDPWTHFLLERKPALLSIIFLILIFGMPFVISFLAFNQISGDVQNHGLRYLLLRTERCNIFFGRFIGTAFFSTAVMAVIIATITLYLGTKVRIYSPAALTVWALQGFLALSILMVPYIAVCSLISASVNSPFLSLILAKVVIAGVLLLAILGRFAWKPAKYVLYVLPWGWQNNLLHPAAAHWLGAVVASLAYTAFFLMLGYVRFETRDL
jgi:ABC-type transport system involved in multi-copper enzyme maturation permease subunit